MVFIGTVLAKLNENVGNTHLLGHDSKSEYIFSIRCVGASPRFVAREHLSSGNAFFRPVRIQKCFITLCFMLLSTSAHLVITSSPRQESMYTDARYFFKYGSFVLHSTHQRVLFQESCFSVDSTVNSMQQVAQPKQSTTRCGRAGAVSRLSPIHVRVEPGFSNSPMHSFL